MSFHPAPKTAPRMHDGFREGDWVRRTDTNRTGFLISIDSLSMALIQFDSNSGEEAWISLRLLEHIREAELAS